MNEIEDRLRGAVRAEAGFDITAVAALVAARRRRRMAAVGAAALALIVAIGIGVASLGDDDADTSVVGEGEDDGGTGGEDGGDDDGPGDGDRPPVDFDDTAPIDEVQEDPIGADGTAGPPSNDHLAAASPFVRCDDLPRDGPATGERYARQEAMWQAFADQYSFAEWPVVVGFGSPENVWGMPTVLLTRPDQETFDRLLEFFEPTELCVELPPAELVPPVAQDVPWQLMDVEDDLRVTLVEQTDCAVKAQHLEPFVLEYDDRVEVGIQAWSEPGLAFNDDCPPPATYVIDLPSPLAGRPLVAAASRPLVVDDTVAPGGSAAFTVAEINRGDVDLIGDDLIARLVGDPTVRFQVSDVFAAPVAGRARAVALDQHPWTGAGTILVPADAPSGTYSIQFLDRPDLNGTLVVS